MSMTVLTKIEIKVCVCPLVLLCVCVSQSECCYATLIPVRALSQACGRSGSKTHKSLKVFPSNQTWTDTERKRVLAVFLPTGTLIFFYSQEAAGWLSAQDSLLPNTPSYNLCPYKMKADKMQRDAASVRRKLADLHQQRYVTDVMQPAHTSPDIFCETCPVPKPHHIHTHKHTRTHITKSRIAGLVPSLLRPRGEE